MAVSDYFEHQSFDFLSQQPRLTLQPAIPVPSSYLSGILWAEYHLCVFWIKLSFQSRKLKGESEKVSKFTNHTQLEIKQKEGRKKEGRKGREKEGRRKGGKEGRKKDNAIGKELRRKRREAGRKVETLVRAPAGKRDVRKCFFKYLLIRGKWN